MVAGRGDIDDLFHCLMDHYHYLSRRGNAGEHIKYMVYDCQERAALLPAVWLIGLKNWGSGSVHRVAALETPGESEADNQQHMVFDSVLGGCGRPGEFYVWRLTPAFANRLAVMVRPRFVSGRILRASIPLCWHLFSDRQRGTNRPEEGPQQ